ncbi:MAG: ATP-binding protein [Microcoleaceae cyanobacterium]
MVKDVTQPQQQSEQLRQSEANLSAAQRVAHVGSWDFNVLTQAMTWSEELYRIFGLEPELNTPSYDDLVRMIHPEDRESFVQQINLSLIEKIPDSHEFRLIRPSGEIRYVESRIEVILNDNHQVIRLFGVILDLTERMQMEVALQEREKQYRDLVQTANCIILRWDTQGNIVFINQYGAEFFCGLETDILGQSIMDTIVPEWDSSGQDLQALMQQICQQPNAFIINENENIRQDGERVWVNWANKPIFDEAGELVEILSIGTDITDRKRSEVALAQKNIDLETAKKAAEKANQVKSQFLANMSHELRTPLNAILGFAQVMQRTLKYNPEQFQQESAEYLDIIQNSGNHLLSLINDVLDMAKIEAGKVIFHPDCCDLHQLLRSLEAMFQSLAQEKGLILEFKLTSNLPRWIETDQAKLRQILINLLSNAIKCTQIGSITLRVWGDDTLYFAVEDTGCGIAPEQLQKLFDPFYQVESTQKYHAGTGLGLSITQSYIKMFGGDIKVESTLGKGSIFQFYIPVTLTESLNLPEAESPLSVVHLASNQPSYRILVVEDQWESRVLLVELLKSLGFEQVREAINGKEAVNIFESWQPHLIWMDMRMPVMDGYEATQQIRRHLKGQAPAIIALTASALEQEKQIVLSAGCDDFVHKPFQEQVICDKLRQYLGIKYIYDQQSVRDRPQTQNDMPQLTASRLSQVPKAWLVQLHEAARLADAEWIGQLMEERSADEADITQIIQDWVKRFRYELIEELAESSIRLHE